MREGVPLLAAPLAVHDGNGQQRNEDLTGSHRVEKFLGPVRSGPHVEIHESGVLTDLAALKFANVLREVLVERALLRKVSPLGTCITDKEQTTGRALPDH